MKSVMNKILKELKKKGATDIILEFSKSNANQIKFSNNLISTTKTWTALDLSIFIAVKNKLAVTSLKEFDNKTINHTIKNLIKFAKLSPNNEDFLSISKGPFKYKKIKDGYDKKLSKLNTADMTKEVITEAVKNEDERTNGILQTVSLESNLLTSSKVDISDKGSEIHLSIRTLTKDSSGHCTATSRILNKFDYLSTARESSEIARESKKPVSCKPGKYDVIFTPLAFANLLSQIGDATSIFSVESGFSFLSKSINKKVSSDKVTLVDDPLVPNGVGSTAFDAEGTPTKRNVIIDRGKLKTFLHNTSTAKRYKVKNTANAGIISPEAHNLVLKKSDWSKDEMIKSINNGIIITNLWYTRFTNYLTGKFSTIPRDGAFLIKNGKIVKSVKGMRISESLPNILNNVHAIGKNPEQIISWETTMPITTADVLVKNVNITKPVE